MQSGRWGAGRVSHAPACLACFFESAVRARSRISSSEAPARIASRSDTSEPPKRHTYVFR